MNGADGLTINQLREKDQEDDERAEKDSEQPPDDGNQGPPTSLPAPAPEEADQLHWERNVVCKTMAEGI